MVSIREQREENHMDRTVDNAPPRSASPTAMAQVTGASYSLDFGKDEGSRRLIARMVRVMYPHKNFGDGLYERSAEAILKAPARRRR